MVERLFRDITTERLRRGVFTSVPELVAAIDRLVGLDAVRWDHFLRQYEEFLLRSIDFSSVPVQGMLSLLLFASALHVDLWCEAR